MQDYKHETFDVQNSIGYAADWFNFSSNKWLKSCPVNSMFVDIFRTAISNKYF